MESIIVVVGFLGAGKTTLLKQLTQNFNQQGWSPYIILNDYENAYLDAQYFLNQLEPKCVKALSGSCICCSGIKELRDFVNRIPQRDKGITLIEANGTSDAESLMEFLGVGLEQRFLPPVQISVVDVKNWQKRLANNDLELHQVLLSSLLVLTHIEHVEQSRLKEVIIELKSINPQAKIIRSDEVVASTLSALLPIQNKTNKKTLDHQKAHWSSASVDMPVLTCIEEIQQICMHVPSTILRIKGCVKLKGETNYTYFERTPDGTFTTRPFNGIPITGAKLLSIGVGSSPELLLKAIKSVIKE